MSIRRFTYTDPTISATIADPLTNSLWIAYNQNGSGNCIIKKVVGTSPNQLFFTVTRAVTTVNDMKLSASYLYVAYQHATVFAESFLLTSPLLSYTPVGFPSGVVESPIACVLRGTSIWFLTPGLGGNYAKLTRFNTSLVWQQTVILNTPGFEVTSAIDVTVDSNNDLQVITNTNPSTFVRVYDTAVNVYAYQITATP